MRAVVSSGMCVTAGLGEEIAEWAGEAAISPYGHDSCESLTVINKRRQVILPWHDDAGEAREVCLGFKYTLWTVTKSEGA